VVRGVGSWGIVPLWWGAFWDSVRVGGGTGSPRESRGVGWLGSGGAFAPVGAGGGCGRVVRGGVRGLCMR